MERIVQALVYNLHFLFIAYGLYSAYEHFGMQEQMLADKDIEIQNLNIEKAKRDKDRKILRDFKQDIDNAKKRIENVAYELERLQKQIPVDVSDATLLDFFDKEARDLNILSFSSAPKGSENKGFYFSKEFSFSMTSTFLQAAILLEKFQSAERMVNVKNIQLSSDESLKSRSRFQMIRVTGTLETYTYNPSHIENRGIEEIEKKFK